jgi:hypothetical protein
MPISKGTWKPGKTGGTVVTDDPEGFNEQSGHSEIEYYGGYLIAESILNPDDIKAISAIPEMEHALRTFIVAMDKTQPEEFPGHHSAYLENVALPRAKEALKKAGIKYFGQ